MQKDALTLDNGGMNSHHAMAKAGGVGREGQPP